jgi:hypothetical protein
LTAAQQINGENCTIEHMIIAMEMLYHQQHNARDGDQAMAIVSISPKSAWRLLLSLVLGEFASTVVALGTSLLSVMLPSQTFTFVQVEEEEPVVVVEVLLLLVVEVVLVVMALAMVLVTTIATKSVASVGVDAIPLKTASALL